VPVLPPASVRPWTLVRETRCVLGVDTGSRSDGAGDEAPGDREPRPWRGIRPGGTTRGTSSAGNRFSEEGVRSVEVTPADGSCVVVRLVVSGPVRVTHEGTRVDVAGGRAGVSKLAAWLKFVAADPASPRVPCHAHLEHYPGHPWLAADTEPVVLTRSD